MPFKKKSYRSLVILIREEYLDLEINQVFPQNRLIMTKGNLSSAKQIVKIFKSKVSPSFRLNYFLGLGEIKKATNTFQDSYLKIQV